MFTPQEPYQARLLDHHAFRYESKKYGIHVRVSPENARANFPALWGCLQEAFGNGGEPGGDGIVDACILLWPETGAGPGTWAYSSCWSGRTGRDSGGVRVGVVADADRALTALAGGEAASDFPPRLVGPNRVAVFYLLHLAGKGRDDLRSIHEFLDTPVFGGDGDGSLIRDGAARTAREVLAGLAHWNESYQRLAVVFSCRGPDAATRLGPLFRDVVVSLVTNWGQEIEEKEAEAGGAEDQARAWAHEIGNCIAFMNLDNATRYPHLYRWAQHLIDMHLISATKSELPSACKGWPNLDCIDIIEGASELAARMAVLRCFRGAADAIGREDQANVEFIRFKNRLVDDPDAPRLRVDKTFVATLTGNIHRGRNRFAAFAQLLVCGLYNAMQHSPPRPNTVRVLLQPELLQITNDLDLAKDRPHRRPNSGGTEVTLKMAHRVLWDGFPHTDLKFEESDGAEWVMQAALPRNMWRDERCS
jgi:hypothetical protein